MADWAAIHRQAWHEVLRAERGLQGLTDRFFAELMARLRAQGFVLDVAAERELAAYLAAAREAVSAGIASSVRTVAAGVADRDRAAAFSQGVREAVAGGMDVDAARAMVAATIGATVADGFADPLVLAAMQEAFDRRWPDGLRLSDRLWRWEGDMRRGVSSVLADGVRAGASMSRLVMDLQRSVERSAGRRFAIPQPELEDWVTSLEESARGLIRGQVSRAAWDKHLEAVRGHVDRLRSTGTRTAAEQVLTRVGEAVRAGNEELIDEAVHWWVYDRQLYHLKRIARTEMATAAHRATIAVGLEDPDVIGFHWRLSASHPEPDICDYYANVDLGLGAGVWPRDQVPPHKAHPHCMCLLVPRVTPRRRAGSVDFAGWVESASETTRRVVVPRWAQQGLDQGLPLRDLIRADGFGFVTRSVAIERVGAEFFS